MFWGVICTCLSVVLFVLVLVGSRNPAKPRWAGDLMVQYVWVIAMISFAASGLVMIGSALGAEAQAIGTQEWVGSLVVAGVTIALLWVIAPRKRLQRYAAPTSRIQN
jgi:hypothetical protein